MGILNTDTEEALESLPDLVADALEDWRRATLMREKEEALLYLRFKGEDNERSATEIKALVHSSDSRYLACLDELKAESKYERLYERLMSKKKIADLRTAF